MLSKTIIIIILINFVNKLWLTKLKIKNLAMDFFHILEDKYFRNDKTTVQIYVQNKCY